MMMEPINDSFFVSVTTPAASEPDTISPFPTFDEDESLISGNSIETEPESTEEEEDDEDDDDDDDEESSSSSSSDESSSPPLPDDIGYIIDSNGVSLLANLNRKLLEHRYGKDYKFDKVPVTTKIDVDDAVDTMVKMEDLLQTGNAELMAVIPKSPSSDVGRNGGGASASSAGNNADGGLKNNKADVMEKMMENLTKDDLQVLYKAVMGKEMPVESMDSREEGVLECRDDDGDGNPLDQPLPSILEESLSGSTTTAESGNRDSSYRRSSSSSPKKKKNTVQMNPIEEETVEVVKSKRGLGFLKKMNIFKKKDKKKKNTAAAAAGNMSKKEMSSASTKSGTISYRASSPFQAPSIKSFKSRVSEERDDPEERDPTPEEAELAKVPTERSVSPIVAAIVDTNDDCARDAAEEEDTREVVEEEAPVDDNPVIVDKASSDIRDVEPDLVEAFDRLVRSIVAPGTESKEDGPKEETVDEEEIPEEANKEEEPGQVTEYGNPTVEEPIVNTNSDLVSLVCEVNANGAEVEVLDGDDAIELDAVHILPEAPISPTATEYSHTLADQGEKSFGRRFSKALRGKKNKSSTPSEELLESEDIKLTPENPVIEIPLSIMKPRKSLMKKYHEKKPKLKGVSSPKVVETPQSPKKGASKRVPSPLREKSEKEVEAKSKPIQTSEVSTELTSNKKTSSGASVSSKKSTKSSKSKRSKKSTKKSTKRVEEASEEVTKSNIKSLDDDMHVVRENNSTESDGNGFGSLRGYQDSDMESFEEAGALMFCGTGNPGPKHDWLTSVEKTFTQMFDYWDHTPAEAYENTKVYEENSRDDESVNSRFSKIHRSRSQSRGDRSVSSKAEKPARSPSNRSVKSRGDKSTRSKSCTDKSVGDKSRSRSQAKSDKSVGEKSAKSARSRSKSIKSVKSSAKAGDVKPATAKSTDVTPEKKAKKSGSQSTSGKSTAKTSNAISKTTAEMPVPVKKAVAKTNKPSAAAKNKAASQATKAETKPKSSTVKKATGKKTARKNARPL